MKINKLLIILSVAVTTFLVSCEDYEDTVVPSPAVSADNAAVRFAASNPTQYEFEPTATGFDLCVIRANASGALEVPISVVTNTDNSFTIPSTLSFAAGEDTIMLTIVIDYANATAGKDLEIGIMFGGENLNPYKAEYSEYNAIVAILDWQKYAAGTYTSALYGVAWAQDLYKATGTSKYRFFDLYATGTDLNFEWEVGEEELVFPYETNADGYHIWMPGIEYGSYGAVTVLLDSSPSWTFYNAEYNYFQIEGDWTVAAGSFGWLDDYFDIASLY